MIALLREEVVALDLDQMLDHARLDHVVLDGLGEHGGLSAGLPLPDLGAEVRGPLNDVLKLVLDELSTDAPLWHLLQLLAGLVVEPGELAAGTRCGGDERPLAGLGLEGLLDLLEALALLLLRQPLLLLLDLLLVLLLDRLLPLHLELLRLLQLLDLRGLLRRHVGGVEGISVAQFLGGGDGGLELVFERVGNDGDA